MHKIIEFKSAEFAVNSFDEIKGIFTGYASAFNKIDKVNDTVAYGAFDYSINQWKEGKAISVNFEHDKKIELAPNLIEFFADQYGALVRFQFSEEAKNNYPDIYRWAVSKAKNNTLFMSIGYTFIRSALGDKRYTLKKKFAEPDTIYNLSLNHVAITGDPVDPSARMLEVKGFKMPKFPIHLSETWDEQEAMKNWREFSKSKDSPSDSYKNGFLYFEDGKEDLFAAYHFNLVDIIDGEPMINSAAVVTAHRYIKGARNGVKILNAEQKITALDIISKLYTKINRLRKEEGLKPLPEVEVKADINFNELIETIDGEVSAKRFLKSNQGSLSNTNIENFINKVISVTKNEVKSQKELEVGDWTSVTQPTSVSEVKTNELSDYFSEVGKFLTKK